eukprot:jgi/Tetstr1/465600/TSEL_010247.t1
MLTLGIAREFSAYVQPLQVATGIAICTALAGTLYGPILGVYGLSVARDWYSSLQWAAITTLLVTQPMLGATLQTCVERAFGTVLGGTVGFLINSAFFHVFNIFVMTALSSFVFVVGFSAIGLHYAAKVGAMTMLIVSMGGFTRGTVAATLRLAVSRTLGILAGIGVGALVSTLLFQQPAHGTLYPPLLMDRRPEKAEDPQGAGTVPASSKQDAYHQPLPAFRSFRAFRQKMRKSVPGKVYDPQDPQDVMKRNIRVGTKATAVMSSLRVAREAAAVAKHEKYVYSSWLGLSFFVPTWPWRADSLPFEELDLLGMAILDVGRIIWSLDLTLIQGFDDETQDSLSKRLPPGMLPSIRRTATDALQGIRDMSPVRAILEDKQLAAWESVLENVTLLDNLVELLLDLSLWNRH